MSIVVLVLYAAILHVLTMYERPVKGPRLMLDPKKSIYQIFVRNGAHLEFLRSSFNLQGKAPSFLELHIRTSDSDLASHWRRAVFLSRNYKTVTLSHRCIRT